MGVIQDPYLEILKGYEKEYYVRGIGNLIPRIWGGVKEEDREMTYKKALEQGKKWEEIVDVKIDKDAIL